MAKTTRTDVYQEILPRFQVIPRNGKIPAHRDNIPALQANSLHREETNGTAVHRRINWRKLLYHHRWGSRDPEI